MTLLIIGLISFIGLHMVPYWARGFRTTFIDKMGAMGYRILFSICSLTAFLLIIFGWRGIDPGFAYVPPSWGPHVTPLFVLAAFVLFIASNAPTNIRRKIRHPQMTAIFLWATGHLLSNGEMRSLLLFGSFALWAVVAIVSANRRDPIWIMPEKQPVMKDIITVVIALVAFGAFFHFHEAIIGVSPLPF